MLILDLTAIPWWFITSDWQFDVLCTEDRKFKVYYLTVVTDWVITFGSLTKYIKNVKSKYGPEMGAVTYLQVKALKYKRFRRYK